MFNDVNECYDYLHEVVGVTPEALDLAFGLNGYTIETARNILSWETGYDDFESFEEELEGWI